MPRADRQPWEFADGPEVGQEIPITSPPREEVVPGVPARSTGENDGSTGQARPSSDAAPERDGRATPSRDAVPERDGHATPSGEAPPERDGHATEQREVRVDDPELAPELNERLTVELREVIGAARVEVPADRAHAARGERPHPQSALGYLNMHRLQLVRTLAIALTFGGVISLITNDWWFLVLAAALHALGTMAVTLTVIRMTTTTERPSAELAAALTEAGVHSPDEYFSRIVGEFQPEPERGAGEVISPGHNERTASATEDAPLAAAEESSAMTPTSGASRPGGQGAAPDVLIWSTALALLALSIIFPPIEGGGWMWLLTAVMVPLLAGWMVMQWLLRTRGERFQLQGRLPMTAIVVCTALAVAAFCAVVAFAFQH